MKTKHALSVKKVARLEALASWVCGVLCVQYLLAQQWESAVLVALLVVSLRQYVELARKHHQLKGNIYAAAYGSSCVSRAEAGAGDFDGARQSACESGRIHQPCPNYTEVARPCSGEDLDGDLGASRG